MKIGLALGGGGARGLAHVPILEVLDESGIKPDVIAGTSMGAIIGSLYAAGYSGAEIRKAVQENLVVKPGLKEGLRETARKLMRWLGFFKLAKGRHAVLSADGFLSQLIEGIKVSQFEELSIPFRAVATDYYRGEAVVIDEGELLPAIKASLAIPGFFEPVVHEDTVLVDGGVACNLPYEGLMEECDVVIAVDVLPAPAEVESNPPTMMAAVLGMFDALLEKLTQQRLEANPPTLYVRPHLTGIGTLDFDKIDEVFSQTESILPAFGEDLKKVIKPLNERG